MSAKEDLLKAAFDYGLALSSAVSAAECRAPYVLLDIAKANVKTTQEFLEACALAYFEDVYDGAP